MGQASADYRNIKTIIAKGDAAARAALAAAPDTPPEVLYYLAENAEAAVRRAVAENPATPPQADARLARDPDVSVRCALARKAVGEGLDAEARRGLWRMGFTILETLARDKAVRVRKVLTEAFAAPADAPRGIVVGLARDKAESVAAPVLRRSPVLTEDDVIEILDDAAPEWAQRAIAERPALPARVSAALAERGSVPAVASMLANDGAEIADATMESLAERAAEVSEWQAPMVARPGLTDSVLLSLARVVAAPLLALLRARADVGPELGRRIDRAAAEGAGNGGATQAPSRGQADGPGAGGAASAVASRARALHEAGRLSDAALAASLETGEHDFVIEALALRAALPPPRVRRMVRAASGRTMMALAWRAGLSARFGLDLQRDLARIPPPALLYARDGLEFPLTIAEMKAQLALFE